MVQKIIEIRSTALTRGNQDQGRADHWRIEAVEDKMLDIANS
jgi:hypothetical protein